MYIRTQHALAVGVSVNMRVIIMDIRLRLQNLKKHMKEKGIDIYYIPTNDYHNSEYVGDFFKCREYISGFTGSNGAMVITQDEAGLWTDGRYFIQAKEQLLDTGIALYKDGMEGVPKIKDYILSKLKANSKEKQTVIGFDGKCVVTAWVEDIIKSVSDFNVVISAENDLIGDIWQDRPKLKSKPVMCLDIKYAGESRQDKLKKLRNYMQEKNAAYHILTSLDDIAWLLNIRGNDIHCNPVVLSYLVISQNELLLFADEAAFDDNVRQRLCEAGVIFKDYDNIYEYVSSFENGSQVMLDKAIVNYAIVQNIPNEVSIINEINPTMLWKAVKNSTEIANEKIAHIKDGIAVTKFIYWLKKNVGKIPMTEISVSEKLEEIRSRGEHYIGPSFDTISGYAEHGAIVHYSATPETDFEIYADNFLLIDTGGHYLEGTTDITRTVMLGNATEEQKKYYTAVLRGNLNLCAAHFLHGCSGVALDYLARKPLWDMGCDYRHGTGHGVGYLLNVHEGPNAFRYKIVPALVENAVLEQGMITSDEPGIYLEGKYGIRLENLILCVEREKTEYGQFLGFEPLTFVPFDREAIDVEQMNKEERKLLNNYHTLVYNNIAEYLESDERKWLKEQCKPV